MPPWRQVPEREEQQPQLQLQVEPPRLRPESFPPSAQPDPPAVLLPVSVPEPQLQPPEARLGPEPEPEPEREVQEGP